MAARSLALVSLAICVAAPLPTLAQPGQDAQQRTIASRIDPDIAERLRNFTVRRGLRPGVEIISENRKMVLSGQLTFAAAASKGSTRISGTRRIPILLAMPRDTGDAPYPEGQLQQQLFGSWPTGTMTDYYREVSFGVFTVTGTVLPWVRLPLTAEAYEGPVNSEGEYCNALCEDGKMVRFITDTLSLHDAAVDFREYDNDGPDGRPNSGDDDGYVDFVALVHPEMGGECTGSRNIWSHRFSLTDWQQPAYETGDVGKSGAKIRIDDYVIMPGLACDGTTMIQIGVFAHEFGHAFGLPDLYDANERKDGLSSGIGNWGLMGSGSWGGDNETPSRPSHMSAWEKAYLGWVQPQLVRVDRPAMRLNPVGRLPQVLKLPISTTEYYLIEYRTRTGFDDSLRGSGILVWKVDESVLTPGLETNSVNTNPERLGLQLIEADGNDGLVWGVDRGDAGDMFRGSLDRRLFDASTTPASRGTVALCAIGAAEAQNSLDIIVSRTRC